MSMSRAGRPFPLAPSMELLWEFMSALSPGDPAVSREITVEHRRLHGDLDVATVVAALADVVARHDVLRLVFDTVEPDPDVRILDTIEPDVEVVDLTGVDRDAAWRRVQDLADADRRRDFDLHEGPLWAATLVRLAPDDHILLLSFCHMVGDGWSGKVLVEDLLTAYCARLGVGEPLAPLDLGYADLVRLQHQTLPATRERAAYWRARLTPLPPYLTFPHDPPTEAADLTGEVAHPFRFAPGTAQRLRAVARRVRTSPYVALMAAYHVLVAGRTGRERVVIGTTTLGRDTVESRSMIGQFTNDVCVAVEVFPDTTLLDVVADVHGAMAEAAGHVMPYRALARAVNPRFDELRPWPDNHLFDSYLQSAVPASAPLTRPGLTVEQLWIDDDGAERLREPVVTAREVPTHCLPVWVKRGAPIVVVDDDRAGGVMIANAAFYTGAFVDGLVADYVRIVESLAANPARAVRDLALGTVRT